MLTFASESNHRRDLTRFSKENFKHNLEVDRRQHVYVDLESFCFPVQYAYDSCRLTAFLRSSTLQFHRKAHRAGESGRAADVKLSEA